MSKEKDKFFNNIMSLTIVAVMIFTASFLFKYKDILTAGEMSGILILGIYASMYLTIRKDK